MGIRNYLIEGVSGAGKTSVATELQRRGYHVVHGDRELTYKGDPATGEPIDLSALEHNRADFAFTHRHHLWDVAKVTSLIADKSRYVSFFCGGSRNFDHFIDLFDGVFVLSLDAETLIQRLAVRPDDEFGGRPDERTFVLQLLASKEDIPRNAIDIDATVPLAAVVDDILSKCRISH
ncbi:nucleoside kinase [Rhizobium sp. RM]|uniref:nucleoside kinase n=1 Tax=Rhizobium sp. RM TaxID=2748079 RepID=UPI00110D612A|nr:nucleoside kinase [Rhizobium sp. RM]NWJ25981.1 nucleoside kinase [Rhizobium sp. RM]TMV20593.1 nucleoside kinase [Rhizobium sp. Td3]